MSMSLATLAVILSLQVQGVYSYSLTNSRHNGASWVKPSILQKVKSSTSLHLDLSDFPSAAMDDSLSVLSSSDNTNMIELQNAATFLVGAFAYFIYNQRPRGSCRDDLVEVKKSVKIKDELGVIAKTFVPAGTVIGTYPGYLKKETNLFNTKKSTNAKDSSKKYIWQLSTDLLVDPTDDDGKLQLEISYFFGLGKVPTTMARINEPPRGSDCSAFSRDEPGGTIQIITERDLFAGDEVFIDYGRGYDRSEYGGVDRTETLLEIAQKERQQKEMEALRMNPIVMDDENPGASLIDQDTSMNIGFLSKLSKRDQGREKQKEGIMSPEDAMKMFSEQGDAMFGSDEDKDLMESLTGKSSSVVKGPKESGGPSASLLRPDSAAGPQGGVNDEQIKSFLRMIDRPAQQNEDPDDIFGSSAGLLSADEMSLLARSKQVIPSGAPIGKQIQMPWQSEAKESASSSSVSPDMKSPAMAAEEAEDLQRRLDNMSDEQVEQVFKKLRESVGEKMRELGLDEDVLSDNEIEKAKKELEAQRVKKELPKTEPINKAVREQYENELGDIEKELEKMYNDPLGVWRDLLKKSDTGEDSEEPSS